MFAILQEAVNNVLKHAAAQNCWIEIEAYENRLTRAVSDDGKGFDVTSVQTRVRSARQLGHARACRARGADRRRSLNRVAAGRGHSHYARSAALTGSLGLSYTHK